MHKLTKKGSEIMQNDVSGKNQKKKEKMEESFGKVTESGISKEERDQAYNDYVKQVTPTHNLWFNMLKAFVTGGIICTIGQIILNIAAAQGLDKQTAGGWCSLVLVFLSILLTGLNIYPSIANWGGAGALVPITGFANGVAAPAIEFKRDDRVIIGTSQKHHEIKVDVLV